MAGRSLDDVWRQMQAQQAAQQQQRIAQERALYEQRERQRQEYLQRMRMYEASLSPSATSPAAGAGGGKISSSSVSDFPEVSGQSYNIIWVDVDTDIWKFVVYNFSTGTLSDIYTTDLTGIDWTLIDNWRNVQIKGFTIVFQNNNDSTYRIYFINANGTVVGEKSLDNNEDFQYTERAQGFLGELDSVSTFHHFDGDNVRTHTFEGVDINDIEIDDGRLDDVTKDGSMIVEAPNDQKYFISRPNENLVEITDYLLGSIYVLDYNTDFILATDTSVINAVSQEGIFKKSIDISSFGMSNLNVFELYGENCGFSTYNDGSDTRLAVSYDGDSNQFVTLTFSYTNNYSIVYNDGNWYNPVSSFGKNLLVSSYVLDTDNSIGDVVTDLNIWYLPKGSTEFNNVDLSSFGTVSFILGDGDFTNNRTFTLGENPLFMYATSDSEIIVGFLEEGGFSTQSTGILAASCSNVWGHNIGEHSFAVFDVDWMTDRIWQFYDSNSIITATTSDTNWSWGDGDTNVSLRNGTLAVQHESNLFVYTTEIGLVSGPTGFGNIYNAFNYGINTGVSYEYQVITRFIPGEEGNSYVDGFYLLSKSGLSDYVEFPFAGLSPSTTYTVNDCFIGSDIIVFNFTESSLGYPRVRAYKISTLELIYDFDPGNPDSSIYSYDNRFVIETQNNEIVDFIFIGVNGVETFSINQSSWELESNDIVDNN